MSAQEYKRVFALLFERFQSNIKGFSKIAGWSRTIRQFLSESERAYPERTDQQRMESVENLLAEALDGPLQGSRLQAMASVNLFWLFLAAFRPDTRIFA